MCLTRQIQCRSSFLSNVFPAVCGSRTKRTKTPRLGESGSYPPRTFRCGASGTDGEGAPCELGDPLTPRKCRRLLALVQFPVTRPLPALSHPMAVMVVGSARDNSVPWSPDSLLLSRQGGFLGQECGGSSSKGLEGIDFFLPYGGGAGLLEMSGSGMYSRGHSHELFECCSMWHMDREMSVHAESSKSPMSRLGLLRNSRRCPELLYISSPHSSLYHPEYHAAISPTVSHTGQ